MKNIKAAIAILLIQSHIAAFGQAGKDTEYVLLKKIEIPSGFLRASSDRTFGGDIRIGNLRDGNNLDFIVYRAANSIDGGAVQPCFIGAFTSEGEILWQKGSGGEQPNRPGPVAIHDIDADGKSEVICLFAEDVVNISPFSMKNMVLLLLNGQNGTVKKSSKPLSLLEAVGRGPNWVHQRILIANLMGNPTPQDFIIKLGKTIYAFDHDLNLLWTYFNGNDEYQNCPAYVPAVGDMDNDGRDEINGGYYLLDHDGSVIWERKLGQNMDCVLIDHWDSDSIKRAICSGFGFVMDHKGDTILMLGEEIVPHGQELRVADFDPDREGKEMMIRYNGHMPAIRVVSQTGKVVNEFTIHPSPNNTGIEAVYWNGRNKPALLYNGGELWTGKGNLFCTFTELTMPPVGHERQGWYHCIPVDIAGDDGEEVVLYNPWESFLFIYTANRDGWNTKKSYVPTSKQYNVRLMD